MAERDAQLEQRTSELAVINSIQQGMAAELGFQAIIDLVGDKLREVLRFGDVQIVLWDAPTGTAHVLYAFERGVRIQVPPRRPNVDGPMFKALQAKRPVIANNRAEMIAWGLRTVEGTQPSLATAITPIFSGDRYIGAIVLENHERENAFGEAEVRLLEHRGREHGRGAGERPAVRRDAAAVEGNRAAHRRAPDQQHQRASPDRCATYGFDAIVRQRATAVRQADRLRSSLREGDMLRAAADALRRAASTTRRRQAPAMAAGPRQRHRCVRARVAPDRPCPIAKPRRDRRFPGMRDLAEGLAPSRAL